MIAIANPTYYPGPAASSRKGATMKKRKKAVRNPSHHRRAKRRKHAFRNPAGFARKRGRSRKAGGSPKDMLKELLSMDGAFLVAGGVAGATLPTWALNKFAPKLTGYGRIAAKAGLGVGIAWGLGKFVNKKLGMGFLVTAAASAVSEAINLVQLGAAIPNAPQALQDHIAQNPGVMVPPSGFDYLPSPFPLGPAQLSGPYAAGLAGPYTAGLADDWC